MAEYCKGCKERQDRIDELEARFSDSLDPLVLCKSCGSGNVRYCQISKRFYCAECNSWPPTHWNDEKYARQQWNKTFLLC